MGIVEREFEVDSMVAEGFCSAGDSLAVLDLGECSLAAYNPLSSLIMSTAPGSGATMTLRSALLGGRVQHVLKKFWL